MNRHNHDLAIITFKRRKCTRIQSLKCGQVFDQLAPVALMSGERKIFKLMIVLVQADTRRLRRIRLEVVIEICVDNLLEWPRLGVGSSRHDRAGQDK